MPEPNAIAIKAVLKLISVSPAVYEKLKEWKGKPTKAEREILVKYCRRIDERRVFRAPFHAEVLEACVNSLSQVKEYTDATLAELEHAGARATLGAILDVTRTFLDKWHGRRTPRMGWMPGFHRDEGDSANEFFEDLGELRGKMKVLVGILSELEPRASCPNLLGAGDDDR